MSNPTAGRGPTAGLLVFSLLCFLLFLLPVVSFGLSGWIVFFLSSSSFLLGFLFSFSDSAPWGAWLAMGYLACVAFVPLWTAALVFKDPFAAILFAFEPVGLMLDLFATLARRLSWSPNDVLRLVAGIVIVGCLSALLAVVAMARKNKSGYWVWLIFIAVSTIASLRILLANALSPGNAPSLYGGPWSPPIWLTIIWPASCALAWWVSWRSANS